MYSSQEATVRIRHGTTDWFQTEKGVCQGCVLSPCLFNFYAQYLMQNAGLDEAQTGINIARRNINNLRYADDTTLMAESEAPGVSDGQGSLACCNSWSRKESDTTERLK